MAFTPTASSSRLATSPDMRSLPSPSGHQGSESLEERLNQLEQNLKETRMQLSAAKEPRAEPRPRKDKKSKKSSTSVSATNAREFEERLSQLEQNLKDTRMQISAPKDPRAEPQLRKDKNTSKSPTSVSSKDTLLIDYDPTTTPSKEEGPSSAQFGFDILLGTRNEWYSQEIARLEQDHEISISHITADLEQKHQIQLKQAESEIINEYSETIVNNIDEYNRALAEQNTSHQLHIEQLRTDLTREHKLQLNKKADNVHANYRGILGKKDTQLQRLTAELRAARQQIQKLKKSSPGPHQQPHQQHVFKDLKANLKRDYQAQLQTKTRNIQNNYTGIIAKKDAQYQQVSQELSDARQASEQRKDTYKAEVTANEAEKVKLRGEMESLREAHAREMGALKAGEILYCFWSERAS